MQPNHRQPREIPEFDEVVARFESAHLSFTEEEALRASHWDMGEDGWLREDARFRQTGFGRWILAPRYLLNELLYRGLRDDLVGEFSLSEQLQTYGALIGIPAVFCTADPRLVLQDDKVRLAATELSDQPLLEAATASQQFVTHLPVLSLHVAAASLPAGEWGATTTPSEIRPIGWLRVDNLGRSLRPNMFVARIRGESMDGGKSPIADRSWAAFEFAFHNGTAYDPGTARPVVLVRGSFEDPETGTFAVKHLERADPSIRLVSANPDKIRFPDIVVAAKDADDVRVVATLTKALRPGDFARRPKLRSDAGFRQLHTKAGLAEVSRQLAAGLERFFDAVPLPPPEPGSVTATNLARLVCLEAQSGGLHATFGPLPRLPAFVKKVRLLGGASEQLTLGSHVRSGMAQVRVAPGEGPWRLEAVGFEDESQALGLAGLVCEQLPAEVATAFRVDVAGVAQRLEGATLAVGGHYRLVVPPQLVSDSSIFESSSALAGGWRLLDLALSAPVPAELVAQLAAIGMSVGGAVLRLDWALTPPAAWRANSRGEVYPVFAEGALIAVQSSGWPTADSAHLFVAASSPGETQRATARCGDLVQLLDLQAGQYACGLWHADLEYGPVTVHFAVERTWPQPCVASPMFQLAAGQPDTTPALWPTVPFEVDLSAPDLAHGPLASLSPGWPVRLSWHGRQQQSLATLTANAEGDYDFASTWRRIVDRAAQCRVADVLFDFGDFGSVTVRHTRYSSATAFRDVLARQVALFGPQMTSASSNWERWLPLWFVPLVRELGYSVHNCRGESSLPGIDSMLFRVLSVDERTGAEIETFPSHLLVLTDDVALIEPSSVSRVRKAMQVNGLPGAIITDGVRWTLHRRADRSARTIFNVLEAVSSADALDALVTELAAGV